MGDYNFAGSKLPRKVTLSPAKLRAICGVMHQSIPSACAPVSAIAFKECQAPLAKTITGTLSFNAVTICRIYCQELLS